MDASRDATVICTLGMHRSGTSLMSRMLNLLGVHLGSDPRVLTSGDDNPKGYWEYRPFVDINDELLARFGGAWDEPPAFPAQWFRDPGLSDLRAKARDLLREDFSTSRVWGWKDPRTCLTLPFWQDMIGPMRYVMCLRNPCAVIASLARRSGMSGEKAERLWLAHAQATLAGTIDQPRVFVSYEDIIEDWRRELRRLASFIGDPARADDPAVHAQMEAFLERELCHHRPSIDDLAADSRVSYPTKSLYLAMRGHATDGDRSLSVLGELALHTSDRMVEVEAEHAARARQLEAAQHALEATRHTSQTTELALQEIQTSAAWRTITSARTTIGRLMPAGTKRRAVYTAVVRSLAPRRDSDPRQA